MEKTYKFRLYPSKKQINNFNNVLNNCKYLYNTQLEYERYIDEKEKRFANRIELNNLLPDLKIINPNFKTINAQILQNVNDRVIKSFNGFFGRVKKGQKAGYPRFKNIHRYNSFTYPQDNYTFKFTSQKKLKLSKIGEVSIKFHRMIKGTIKTLTIIKTPTNKWFACFTSHIENSPPKRLSEKIVGLDLGLENFATLSDGTIIENPRLLKKSLELLQRKSRQLSKKKKGSCNRLKSRLKLNKLYEKVSNQRLDFLHKLTSKLVKEYDCIALEDLQISSMRNKYLQFSIKDASWDKFRKLLTYKAESAGCKLDFVNPKDTSKRCSKCGRLQDMPLSKRTYKCSCGNSLSRDLNSAFNIFHLSYFHSGKTTEGHSGSNACGVEGLPSTSKQEATHFSV